LTIIPTLGIQFGDKSSIFLSKNLLTRFEADVFLPLLQKMALNEESYVEIGESNREILSSFIAIRIIER